MLSILIPNAQEQAINILLNECEALFPEAQIIIATDRYRKGKGHAIRRALSLSTGDIVCFLDGDLDIHPSMINRLLPHLDEFDIVCGKKDPGSRLDRKILTILSRIYIWIMFRIPVDTQTGIKVFKREALSTWKTNSFAFDIEILYNAKKKGMKMFDIGIEAKTSRRMKLKSIFVTLVESVKIRVGVYDD